MEGSRRPECADGCVDVQEVGDVQRSEVMDGLKGEEQNLKNDTGFDGEPVKLLKNRSDVVNGGGSGDDAGGRVLNQLKSVDGFERETKEKGVAVVDAGSDQGVNKNGGALRVNLLSPRDPGTGGLPQHLAGNSV